MTGSGFNLDDYVDVAERIKEFREKYPEGSFQVRLIDLPEAFRDHFVAVEATAYRTPDDQRPARDVAWEPVPGKTPYTRDSELMNASTSAVGRAIVYALAADTSRGIASRQEVANRSSDAKAGPPTAKQVNFLVSLAKKHGADKDDAENIRLFAAENLTGGKGGTCSETIDALNLDDKATAEDRERAGRVVAALVEKASRVPSDVQAELPHEPEPTPEEEAEAPF